MYVYHTTNITMRRGNFEQEEKFEHQNIIIQSDLHAIKSTIATSNVMKWLKINLFQKVFCKWIYFIGVQTFFALFKITPPHHGMGIIYDISIQLCVYIVMTTLDDMCTCTSVFLN